MQHIFTVIIPVYNRKILLFKVLQSLLKQTLASRYFKVLVVDDGSTDDLGAVIDQFCPDLDIQLHKQANQGPAVARQTGALHAQTEWLAFIDSDCVADSNWLQAGFDYLQKQQDMAQKQKIAGKSAKPHELVALEGRTVIPNLEQVDLFSHQTQNLHGKKYPTCNFFIRRAYCNFNPKYGQYGRKYYFREDSDLAFQLLSHHRRIDFLADAVVYHPVFPGNLGQKFRLAMRYRYDGLLAKRFPELYKNEIDCFKTNIFANKLGEITIRHFRTKLYSLYLIFVATLFGLAWLYPGRITWVAIPTLLAIAQLALTLVMAYPAPLRAFKNIWQLSLLYMASPLIALTWAANKLLGKFLFHHERRFEPDD